MKLLDFRIQSYGSIENVQCSDLGHKTLFIGKNGTGKTYILDALNLFFSEFAWQRGDSKASKYDYLWHNRKVGNPIVVSVELEFEEDQVTSWGNGGVNATRLARGLIRDGVLTASIIRSLKFNARWSTVLLSVGGRGLVKNDLIVDRTPTAFLDAFGSTVRECFRYVRPPDIGHMNEGRPASVSAPVLSRMRTVSNSRKAQDESTWQDFTETAESLLNIRLESHPSEPLARVSSFRLPQRYLGGGHQWASELIWRLLNRYSIVALEEPESHMHPGLLRQLIRWMGTHMQNTQFLIATHSPVVVDKVVIRNNRRVRLDVQSRTQIDTTTTKSELQEILSDLGVLPSDILLKDFAIFVEGKTERDAIVPAWMELSGVSTEDIARCAFISLGGKGNIVNNLRIWTALTNDAGVPFHVLLDGDAVDDRQRAIDEGLANQNQVTLLREQSIEETYPVDMLTKALSTIYGIRNIRLDSVDGRSIIESVEATLASNNVRFWNHGRWKLAVAHLLANWLKPSDVPSEFAAVVTRVNQDLGE